MSKESSTGVSRSDLPQPELKPIPVTAEIDFPTGTTCREPPVGAWCWIDYVWGCPSTCSDASVSFGAAS